MSVALSVVPIVYILCRTRSDTTLLRRSFCAPQGPRRETALPTFYEKFAPQGPRRETALPTFYEKFAPQGPRRETALPTFYGKVRPAGPPEGDRALEAALPTLYLERSARETVRVSMCRSRLRERERETFP